MDKGDENLMSFVELIFRMIFGNELTDKLLKKWEKEVYV